MKQTEWKRLLVLVALLGLGLAGGSVGVQAQSPGPGRVFLPIAMSRWSQVELPLVITPSGSPATSEEHFEQLRRGSIFADFFAPHTGPALALMEDREAQVRQALLALPGQSGSAARLPDGGGSVTLPPASANGATFRAGGSIQTNDSNGSYRMQVQTDADLPDGDTVSFTDSFAGQFGLCPDAGGVFQGTVSGETIMSGSQVDGAVRTTFRYQESMEATVTAHVGMDARLSHYDLDAVIVIETNIQQRQAGSGALISNATEVFRSRMTGSHLDPRSDNLSSAQLQWQVWGPGGAVPGGLTSSVLRAEISEALLELSAKALGVADAYLLEAETGWYDQAKCVKLSFDPRHLTLAPSASGQLAIALKGKDDDREVAANMTLVINHGASVSPASGSSAPGAPLPVTLTAPGQPWQGQNMPILNVEATSKRGRAVDHSWIEMEEAIIVVDLQGGPDASYTADENFTFIMFTDEDVSSVIVTNPYASGVATVTAALHYEPSPGNDIYVDEDWTGRRARTFCRDLRAERISDIELWVQFAPGVTPDPAVRPKVMATNIGCWRWRGEATIRSLERPNPSIDIADHTAATVTFERVRLDDITASHFPEIYRPISGSVTWRRWGTLNDCTYSAGPATAAIQPDDGALSIYNYLTAGPERRTYTGSAETELHGNETLVCPSGGSTSATTVLRSWLSPLAAELPQVEPSGRVIYLLTTESSGGIETTYEWEFEALRQP